MQSTNAALYYISDAEMYMFTNIITQDRHMLNEVFPLVKTYAKTLDHLLITGETGTGKDMIARKIHDLSPRRNQPFVEVNLASISPSLFESELFGHRKGSFTGAIEDKIGYFEAASGGTIFLDEIGELSKDVQGKLLRVIQYGEVCRVGDTTPRTLDIRIIAATNVNLEKKIENSEFRNDLYYRLSQSTIQLPPLRARGKDVFLLAQKFLQEANEVYNRNITINEHAFDTIHNYKFPGNVRELRNIIFNSVARAKSNVITSLYNSMQIFFELPDSTEKKISNLSVQTEAVIVQTYVENFKSTELTAQKLNISVRTLQRRLQSIRKSGLYKELV